MSAATLTPPAAAPATPVGPRLTFRVALAEVVMSLEPGQSFVASDVSWETYTHLRDVRDEHRQGVRIQFDRGIIAVMSTTSVHERWKCYLGAFIVCLAEELVRPLVPGGNMTVSRQDLDRGFEPDLCYYVGPSALNLPNRVLNFDIDPPPGLAIEVEHSRSVTGKLPVVAAFRVPEVWRYDGIALTILLLAADGTYQPAARGLAFPEVDPADLARYLGRAATVDLSTLVREFRTWVRRSFPVTP